MALKCIEEIKDNGNTDDTAWILLNKFMIKVSLRRVRHCLVAANLLVLAAGIIYLLAWQASSYIKGGGPVDREHDSDDPLIEIPYTFPEDEVLIKAFRSCLEGTLFLTALNQLFYWLFFGVLLSSRFGCSWSVWLLVLCLPYSLFLVVWQLGLCCALFKVSYLLSGIPTDPLEPSHIELSHLNRFFIKWGPWMISSTLLATPVQIFTMSLCFFIGTPPKKLSDDESPYMKEEDNINSRSGIEDYVDEDRTGNYSNGVLPIGNLSLYKCEMPPERIAQQKVIWKSSRSSAATSIVSTNNEVLNAAYIAMPVWNKFQDPTNQAPIDCLRSPYSTGVLMFPIAEEGGEILSNEKKILHAPLDFSRSSCSSGVQLCPPAEEEGEIFNNEKKIMRAPLDVTRKSCSSGVLLFPPMEEGGEYLAMNELPDYNDFMYLPYTEDRATPPPPYSLKDYE